MWLQEKNSDSVKSKADSNCELESRSLKLPCWIHHPGQFCICWVGAASTRAQITEKVLLLSRLLNLKSSYLCCRHHNSHQLPSSAILLELEGEILTFNLFISHRCSYCQTIALFRNQLTMDHGKCSLQIPPPAVQRRVGKSGHGG